MLTAIEQPFSELLDASKAAEFLDVSPGTLAVWRCTKRYPLPFYKIGRLVRYRREDLIVFIESRLVA